MAPGKLKEVGEKEIYSDPASGIMQYHYSHKVDFVQEVKRKGKAKTTLNGEITYQVCDAQRCMPPKTMAFSVMIP